MFAWENYSSDLFVGREQDVSRLLDWINSSSNSKPVKSLVAPPGAGKTWFLQAVQDRLNPRVKHSDASPERLVIWCDVPRLVNPNALSSPALNQDAILQWLEEIQKNAARLCRDVRRIDRDLEIAASIAQLVTDLCDKCALTHPVIVFVDGLDEITPDQALKVERQILERFIGRKCIRMLIAHRDEYTLKWPLRDYAERFFLSGIPPVREQFEKFKNKFYPRATHLNITNLNQFTRSLSNYRWNHPYINAFLFDKALKRSDNGVTKLLTADDLRECCYAVVERRDANDQPRFPSLDTETFDCLRRIASGLGDDWTEINLEQKVGLKLNNPCVDRLFTNGIVFTNPKQRCQIGEGLRELVRDLVERGG